MQLNINQLAKVSYVSKSTIYRVIDKLELDGLNALKLQVSSYYQNYEDEHQHVDYNFPFHSNNTHYQMIQKMQTLYAQTVQSTINLIDLDDFLKAVQLMRKARHIYIAPTIGNYFMAESFQQSMLEIGCPVDVIKDHFYLHWHITSMTSDDLIIFVSYAGKAPGITDIVKEAMDQKVNLLLITSTYESEISKLIDLKLYFASYESSEEKIASFSSRLSLQFLFDMLYAAYFNTDYSHHLEFKVNRYID